MPEQIKEQNTEGASFAFKVDEAGNPITDKPKESQSAAADPNRPAWLPEKFKTPEDMAKAYGELETKLGSHKPAEEGQESGEAGEAEEGQEEGQEDPYAKFSTELSEKGALSPDSYKELEAMGHSKQVVDTYLQGLQQQQEAALAPVGGKENYSKVLAWAKDNLTPEEITSFDSAVNGPQQKIALEWINSKYSAAQGPGKPQRIVQGNIPGTAPAAQGFRSSAEQIAAMSDPRYKTDPAYRDSVAKRLAATTELLY